MLSRTVLVACPSCARHVLPSDSMCPSCGERLRAADGTIGRTPVAMLMGLGAALGLASVGCGDDSDDGAGGAGTTSNTVGVSTGMRVVSTYGVGPSSVVTTTGGVECDTGQSADINSQLCQDCIDCSVVRSCAGELAAYEANPDAGAFDACFDSCQDPACVDACVESYPAAAALYEAVISCTVCGDCTNNCDASANCE